MSKISETTARDLRLAQESQFNQPRDEMLSGLEDNLQLQAQKISQLLEENERLGSEGIKYKNEITALHAEVARLQSWYSLASEGLNTTDLETARQQIAVLWSYVHAMGSPGHRMITFLGKTFGNNFIGRMLRKLVRLFTAIKNA